MLAADPANSFARYGLAMEYMKSGDLEGSVGEFAALLERDPNYSAGYFHGGQSRCSRYITNNHSSKQLH